MQRIRTKLFHLAERQSCTCARIRRQKVYPVMQGGNGKTDGTSMLKLRAVSRILFFLRWGLILVGRDPEQRHHHSCFYNWTLRKAMSVLLTLSMRKSLGHTPWSSGLPREGPWLNGRTSAWHADHRFSPGISSIKKRIG